ncbi:MAG TPA: hypothetical protein VFB08_05615 [Burkholderiales bacterium]|nr:hypothetical protein [Burkholderiales bacterium]
MIEGVFINLDSALERRAAMEAELARHRPPYPVRRFRGIEGAAQAGRPALLRAGEYGCWLSHLAALGEAGGGEAHLHVMEDDARLSAALGLVPELVRVLEADSGGDWDLLYLDATLVEIADMQEMFEWTQAARKRGAVEVCPIPAGFTVYGTHSYIVNARRKQAVRTFLSGLLASGKPIDNALAYGIQHKRLRAYVTAPFVTTGAELGLDSDIGYESKERFIAWLLFRRLCFVELADADLAELAARSARLSGVVAPPEALFGALCAYRVARWPHTRFPPGIDSAPESAHESAS